MIFFTHKIKSDIDNNFKAMARLYQEVNEKNIELIEKNKSLSERLITQDNRIDKLETLFNRTSILEKDNADIYLLIKNLEDDVNKIKIDINNNEVCIKNKLVDFRREVLDEITKQFFDTLDKIFRTSKEISLIATLINTNSTELGQLKSQLLKPYIDAKHREERIKQGEEIVNKGQKIIETRNKLYEEAIERQRKGEDVNKLKQRIEVYDEIIRGLK